MVVTGFEKPVDRFVESGNKSPPRPLGGECPSTHALHGTCRGWGWGWAVAEGGPRPPRQVAAGAQGPDYPGRPLQTMRPSASVGSAPPPPARHDMTRTHIYQPRLGRHSGCIASSPEQGVARSQRGPHPGGGGGVWPASSLFPALPKGLDIICLYCWRVERELHDFSGESRFFSPSEWQLFFYPGPTSRSGAFLTDPLVQKQPVKLQ